MTSSLKLMCLCFPQIYKNPLLYFYGKSQNSTILKVKDLGFNRIRKVINQTRFIVSIT